MSVDTQSISAFRNRYFGQVATRCLLPTDSTAANKEQGSRRGHFAREHIAAIQLVFPNFWVTTSGVETQFGTSATFTASVEYPVGVFTQMTFSGSTSVATTAGLVFTDIKPISIPNDQKFWTKCKRSDPSGGIIYAFAPYNKSNATHGDALNFGATVTDDTMTTTATNADANNTYGPIAVLGYTRSGSVIFLGDSLAAGQNDTQDASGDCGLTRFIGASLAYMNLGRPSDRGDFFLANSSFRRQLLPYCTDIVMEYGTNDVGAGAQTAAAVIATRASIGTLIKSAQPNKRLWIGTLLPRTTSNTNAAPDTYNANRILINDAARLVPSPYDGCIDFADAFENSRNGGLFANSAWLDASGGGIHPNQTGYLGGAATGFITPKSFRL